MLLSTQQNLMNLKKHSETFLTIIHSKHDLLYKVFLNLCLPKLSHKLRMPSISKRFLFYFPGDSRDLSKPREPEAEFIKDLVEYALM